MTSLNQAKKINNSGIYILGAFSENYQEESLLTFDNSEPTQIKDVMSLKLATENKSYTFEELKDLQNILMLVAPRDNDVLDEGADDNSATLEYFIETFAGISRLSELYLEMIRHGCSFYGNFKIEIYCNINDNEKRVNKIYLNDSVVIENKSGKCLLTLLRPWRIHRTILSRTVF